MILEWQKGGEARGALIQKWMENPNVAPVTAEVVILQSHTQQGAEIYDLPLKLKNCGMVEVSCSDAGLQTTSPST